MSAENTEPYPVDDPSKYRSSVRFSNTIENDVDLPATHQISNTRKSKSFSDRARSTIKKAKEATKEIVHPDCIHDFNKQLEEIPTKKQPKQQEQQSSSSFNRSHSQFLSLTFYKNNVDFFVLILIYILLSVLFVLIQLLVLYPTAAWYVKMARAAGILLNFNSCLVVLLVLRRLTSWIRNTVMGAYFSVLDEFIMFHKVLGVWIFILALVHSMGQGFNACE